MQASVALNEASPKSQRDAPLAAAVSRFLDDPGAAFTTPGHKRAPWLADPLLTIGDDDVTVDRLIAGLRESIERRRAEPRPSSSASMWRVEPEMAMTPRDAFFAPRERVDAARAVGRISAETAAPYPPGIPVLAPGEIITAVMLEQLQSEAAAGGRVAYCSDPTLSTLLVVRQD